jgi:hypothetical protein
MTSATHRSGNGELKVEGLPSVMSAVVQVFSCRARQSNHAL